MRDISKMIKNMGMGIKRMPMELWSKVFLRMMYLCKRSICKMENDFMMKMFHILRTKPYSKNINSYIL